MKIHAQTTQTDFPLAQSCSLEILFQADQSLKPGDRIEFQFPNSWSLIDGPSYTREFQTTDPAAAHFISVTLPDLSAKFEIQMEKRHLFYPTGKARHGLLFTARLTAGEIPAKTPVRIAYENTVAPYIAESETLWLRVNGNAPESAPALKTIAGSHQYFRVIVPSGAKPGQEFDVLIVSLDRFDNVSSTTFNGEKLLLPDDQQIHLDFTGKQRVPVKLSQPGVYRFRLRDVLSNAIKISENPATPFWGDLHIHTKLSQDGQGTNPYDYAREVSGLDFAATADHWESLGPEGYRIAQEWADSVNQPGVFVTLPADERNPREMTGHHNIYFRSREAQLQHQALGTGNENPPANSFLRLKNADTTEVMLIPHHTGISFGDLPQSGTGNAVHWDAVDDRGLRPVMEIYSHHGQSEIYHPQHFLAYEWNRMRNPEHRANTSVPGPFYAQQYWMQDKRIGVIASSDEHSGQGGRRHGGIAAVFGDNLTRSGIFDALRQRRCYATTGERILLDFSLDELKMGECGQKSRAAEVNLTLDVRGTEILLRVEILRHRFGIDTAFIPVASVSPRPESRDATVTFRDKIESDCMYYARITQFPLEWPGMAWASPIWVTQEI